MQPIFKRSFGNKGGVMAIAIPNELIEYLNLDNGDELCIMGEVGKHGRYFSVWKSGQKPPKKTEVDKNELDGNNEHESDSTAPESNLGTERTKEEESRKKDNIGSV